MKLELEISTYLVCDVIGYLLMTPLATFLLMLVFSIIGDAINNFWSTREDYVVPFLCVSLILSGLGMSLFIISHGIQRSFL